MIRRQCQMDLRRGKSALSSILFTLHALRIARIALDLFLSTRRTRDGKTLPRLPSFRNTPLGVHRFAVDHLLAC